MGYPRRVGYRTDGDDDERVGNLRTAAFSPGADVGSTPDEEQMTEPRRQPVEIRIVHEQAPTGAQPQSTAAPGTTARWFWRILAMVAVLAVVVIGVEVLSGLHQLAVGQAAQTNAINRQTGVLQSIDGQLAGIRSALDSLVSAIGNAVHAITHPGG